MRCFSLPFAFFAVQLIASGFVREISANPNGPRERSFRPVVPISQNVRGGMTQMKSQTVKLTIPPPPIPENAVFPEMVASDNLEIPAPPLSSSDSTLPPEPAPKSEPGTTPIAADKAESPGGSETPPATEPKKEKQTGPTLSQLRAEAHALAGKKLDYVFGADDPDSGALDCSSTVQYLLTKIGIEDVPRTSYDQYDWLKEKKLLDDVYGKSASSKLLKKLSPGDLIFWGGTWKSGHRVSHVMLYMGYDPKTDKHYVFGARSKSTTGLTGCGVDIFELDTEAGHLVAHGKIPGLVYE